MDPSQPGDHLAHKVVLQVDAALQEPLHVGDIGGDVVGVADDDAVQVDALRSHQVQDGELLLTVAGMMKGDSGAGGAAGAGGGPGALEFMGMDSSRHADFADDAGADARALGSNGDVTDDDVSQVLDGTGFHVRRMKTAGVPAGAHDDVQTRGVGDLQQTGRVAPQADAGAVHDPAAAPALELQDLANGHVHVAQNQVVRVGRDPGAEPAQIPEGDGFLVESRFGGREPLAALAPIVEQDMLVHDGGAECRRIDGAFHGQNLSRDVGDGVAGATGHRSPNQSGNGEQPGCRQESSLKDGHKLRS